MVPPETTNSSMLAFDEFRLAATAPGRPMPQARRRRRWRKWRPDRCSEPQLRHFVDAFRRAHATPPPSGHRGSIIIAMNTRAMIARANGFSVTSPILKTSQQRRATGSGKKVRQGSIVKPARAQLTVRESYLAIRAGCRHTGPDISHSLCADREPRIKGGFWDGFSIARSQDLPDVQDWEGAPHRVVAKHVVSAAVCAEGRSGARIR